MNAKQRWDFRKVLNERFGETPKPLSFQTPDTPKKAPYELPPAPVAKSHGYTPTGQVTMRAGKPLAKVNGCNVDRACWCRREGCINPPTGKDWAMLIERQEREKARKREVQQAADSARYAMRKAGRQTSEWLKTAKAVAKLRAENEALTAVQPAVEQE